jgi:hypothetical protein
MIALDAFEYLHLGDKYAFERQPRVGCTAKIY